MGARNSIRNSKVATLPQFSFSSQRKTNTLLETNLVTGINRKRIIPSFRFMDCSSWCALSHRYICFTGGYSDDSNSKASNDVVTLDTQREYAVYVKSPMLTARTCHNSVWYGGFLYVLAGYDNKNYLNDCERHSLGNNKWEFIPPISIAVRLFGVVQLEVNRTVYVLGGGTSELIDLI